MKRLACIIFLSLTLVSCKKDTVPDDPQPGRQLPDSLLNRLIAVSNFGEAPPDGNGSNPMLPTLYYSLERRRPVPADSLNTSAWDLSFSNLFRSFINCNNTSSGGKGAGGILIVEKKFEEVVDIPADELFRTGEKAYGTDDAGAFGEGVGWYIYDFDGTRLRSGAYDDAHVAYPMNEALTIKRGDETSFITQPRTILVRTAHGHYAKLRILSIYKDKTDPSTWHRNDDKPYFTFEYVLANAGSKRFSK